MYVAVPLVDDLRYLYIALPVHNDMGSLQDLQNVQLSCGALFAIESLLVTSVIQDALTHFLKEEQLTGDERWRWKPAVARDLPFSTRF